MAWSAIMAKQKSLSAPKDGLPERARGGAARRVSDMLPSVGGAAFRRFGFVQSSIVSRWKDIVGDRYAGVSAPESIRFPIGKRAEGTLTLMVTSAHAPMMQHVIPLIIERVNRFFGYSAVARVTIRQGEIIKPKPIVRRAESALVPTELGDSLRTIADPELRAVLESLARGVAATTSIPLIGKVR
jgi:hypothetical protein